MSDEKKPDPVTPEPGDPKGQPDPVAQVKDAEGVMAKNKELLGEIAGLKKKLSSFESKSDKEKEDKLKEEGKLKELLEKKEGELKDSREAIKRAKVETAMERAGIVDPDYADVLMKVIQFDAAGQPINLDEVFKDWKERKPWAFKQPEPDPKPRTNNTGASWRGTGKIFTTQDLQSMTPEERETNKAEIDRQFTAGLLK